jgi:predicted transcriptional regulator
MDIAKGGETPLRFYTEDSNLLAQLACLIMAAYVIRRLVKGTEVPALGLHTQVHGGLLPSR